MSEAIIIVLQKPGKDKLLQDSYRPISLLNTDVELLAHILATRLAGVMPKLVHKDQSGFISTRSMANNIRHSFLNLQIQVVNPGNKAILSMDAAKALDSIEWTYLWEVLTRFGLGDQFITWIHYTLSL